MFLNIHKTLLEEVLYVISKITRQPRKMVLTSKIILHEKKSSVKTRFDILVWKQF